MTRSAAATLAAVLGVALSAGAAVASTPDASSSFQIDSGHSGVAAGSPVEPPLTRAWAYDLGGRINNVVVADERVVAIVDHRESDAEFIKAFDTDSGRQVWSHPAGHRVVGTTSDRGRVYTIEQNRLTAYSIATGDRIWQRVLTGGDRPDELGVAADGRLHVVTHDHLQTFDGSDGSLLWRQLVSSGETGPTAAGGGRVFTTQGCGYTNSFDAATGAVLWAGPPLMCNESSDGRMPVLHGAELHTRSVAGPARLLNAASGAVLSESPSRLDSDAEAWGDGGPMPVRGLGLVFRRDHDALVAERVDTGEPAWRYRDPALLATEPILANGVVYVGSRSGHLRGLDARTGSLVWSAETGRRFDGTQGGGSQTYLKPAVGLAAGDGLIVAPSGDRLVAYRGSQSPEGSIDTSLTSAPRDPTAAATASFSFGSSRPAAAFECRLDGGAWKPCVSGERVGALEPGGHVFEVRATSAGSVDATPAAHRWAVMTPPEREERDAVAFRQNAARDGHSAQTGLRPPLERRWTRTDLGPQVSYPLVVGGRVFVTAGRTDDWRVYALDAQSGETQWSHPLDGGQPASPTFRSSPTTTATCTRWRPTARSTPSTPPTVTGAGLSPSTCR